MSKKEFVGLVLDGDIIQIALLTIANRKLHLSKIDKITLSENPENLKKNKEENLGLEDVFGIEDAGLPDAKNDETDETQLQEDDDILSLVEDDKTEEQSDEMIVQGLLSSISTKRVEIGLNIPSGVTVFQVFKDQNYSELKKKELLELIQDKLETLYGAPKSSDSYSQEIRTDGSLVLASDESESVFLDLIERSKTLYPGRVFIREILPDEATLINLVRVNYELNENEVTGIVLFGTKSSRLIFMKGKELWLVSPIINEGKNSSHVLGTIFSKILFQLDAGELPSLERIILANNWLGEKSIDFFQKNFPDIIVEEFKFNSEKIEFDSKLDDAVSHYTTAIGMAWAASGQDTKEFSHFSFLPGYIRDRQKLFKLEWHGVVLLLLIALTPLWFNHFYGINNNKIQSVRNEIERTQIQINNVHSLVVGTNYLSQKYSIDNEKLQYVKELSQGTLRWSKTLKIINDGFKNIHGAWITSMQSSKNGLVLEGYSLYRDRIPKITALFANATLKSVSITKIRKLQAYKYNILVKSVVSDSTAFSPIYNGSPKYAFKSSELKSGLLSSVNSQK